MDRCIFREVEYSKEYSQVRSPRNFRLFGQSAGLLDDAGGWALGRLPARKGPLASATQAGTPTTSRRRLLTATPLAPPNAYGGTNRLG